MRDPVRAARPSVILALVCAAQFVVVLDIAIVNVALPSMQADLAASGASIQWVVIAYGLTLGGGMLLGGRVADLFGRRNVLTAGIVTFTAASLVAGSAGSFGLLVAARALQGVGGALAVPAALSIVAATFPEGPARNRALGIFGAVGGTAGTVGVMAGGALTSGPGWQWIFLINVPFGVVIAGLVAALIPPGGRAPWRSLDVAGAAAVTAGLMAVVYAINQSAEHGWGSGRVVGPAGAGAGLLLVFVVIEGRVPNPLVPLSIFRHRTLTASVVVSFLLWGSLFASIFQGTLFMQQALGYSAIGTGVAWLATTTSSLLFSGAVAPRTIGVVGAARTAAIGMAVMAAGLLHLTAVATDGGYWTELFPGFVAFGAGSGLAAVAVQVAAFRGIDPSASGLAGGLIETSREVGGAIGVAVVATMALARADDLLRSGASSTVALTEGYQRGSLVAAGFSLAAAVAAGVVLRRAETGADRAPDAPMPVGAAAPTFSDPSLQEGPCTPTTR